MKTMPIRRLLVMLVFLTLLGMPNLSQALDLSGQVKGAQGDPKKFVTVQLDGPSSYVALTDANGKFSVKNVSPGRYRVKVTQGDKVQTSSMAVSSETLELVVKW